MGARSTSTLVGVLGAVPCEQLVRSEMKTTVVTGRKERCVGGTTWRTAHKIQYSKIPLKDHYCDF